VTQALIRQKKNVLEKAGKVGIDFIIDYLFGWRTVNEISEELRKMDLHTTNTNVRKHLDDYKRKYESKKPVGVELITRSMVKTRLSEIKKEFQEAIIQDPILVLHKNIYELEQMKSPANDLKSVGSILELQSKFATQLAKLIPAKDVKIDVNKLLGRNDLGVNFIIQMDSQHPELDLKTKFLEFIQANSDDI